MSDAGAVGPTVGLTEAIEGQLYKQFKAQRKTDGKVCPGEEICQRVGAPNGNAGLKDLEDDQSTQFEPICAKCDFLPTKPGAQPGHLVALMAEVFRLDRLRSRGATFAYPDALPPILWAGLDALEAADRKDQEETRPKQKETTQASDQANAQAKLEARLGRK